MSPLDIVVQLGTFGQQHPQALLLGALGIPLTLAGVHTLGRWRRGGQTTHGSARWATLGEVRTIGLVGHQGVIAGRLKRRFLADAGETHVLLMGPTRAGKGTGTIVPTLLTWRGSAIILDPKDGENADVTQGWRATQGEVALFTPCRSPQTCINILDTIRLRARESSTGTHFRELAALLLTAASLHVCYVGRRPSLAGAWYFLTQEHPDLHTCLDVMAITPHHGGRPHPGIASLVAAIRNIAGDRELSSVWSTAIRPLSLYNDPMIAASTETSTIDLDALQYGARPLSLYLVAPSPMDLERLHPLYRVILDVAMTRLMQHPVRTWRHRLLFCGDELPWYGYTRAVDKGIAVMAGYGIKCLLVTQDLPALEEVYGQHTAIWGNTGFRQLIDHPSQPMRYSRSMMPSCLIHCPRGEVARHDATCGARTLQTSPLSRRDYQPWRLAVLPLQRELPRCGRDDAGPGYYRHPRSDPPVVPEIWAGLRQSTEASTRPARG